MAVRAVAPAGNRFAIGAKVTVSGGGTKQMREIRSGGSFLSQNDLRAYFGLGDYAGPVDVEIRMPGGRRWAWKQLPGDRLHVLTLSGSAAIPRSRSRPMGPLCVLGRSGSCSRASCRRVPLVGGTAQVEQQAAYRPELAVSETLQPFLKQLEPGNDAFPLERQAQELEARLRELSDALRGGGRQRRGRRQRLLDPGFRGAPLLPDRRRHRRVKPRSR